VRFLLLMLTTTRRLVLALVIFLMWAPAAYAWSWPVQGPVLQAFSYDEAHPYAAGQHRGIDIGADAAGQTVAAPATGTVSFAGTVPTSGKSVTIDTADGYAVTLTHLGTILVAKGAAVGEDDAIGTVGPSGTAEVDGPYVHLGIRVATDPNGYLDPLGLLPPAATGGATGSGSAASQPSSGSGSATASGSAPNTGTAAPPATQPAGSEPASRPASSGRTTASHARPSRSSHAPRAETRPNRSQGRPEAQPGPRATARTTRAATPAAARPVRRPVVETGAPAEPAGLDAGHEIRSSGSVRQPAPSRQPAPGGLLALILNGAAAVVAVSAALIAARGHRRRRHVAHSRAAVRVLHLPRRELARLPFSRAA
jgi:Peptidase family M23